MFKSYYLNLVSNPKVLIPFYMYVTNEIVRDRKPVIGSRRKRRYEYIILKETIEFTNDNNRLPYFLPQVRVSTLYYTGLLTQVSVAL